MELIKRAAAFLYEIKSINTPQLRPEAVMPEFAQAVLKERGLTAPLGEIKQLPDSAYSGSK
jgi:NitT/TauT family transport system substrate-binding protein